MRGKCYICGKEYSKQGINKHIKSCKEIAKYVESDISYRGKSFVIMISDKYDSEHWLVIRMDKRETLRELDYFLRGIWLECCGHLSSFTIYGERYDSDAGINEEDSWCGESMYISIGKLVDNKNQFSYEYDFGDTTDLVFKVVDEREFGYRNKDIEILARNNIEGRYTSPRVGQCAYYGDKKYENEYLLDDKNDIKNDFSEKDEIIESECDSNNEEIDGFEKLVKRSRNRSFDSRKPIQYDMSTKEFFSRFKKNEMLEIAKSFDLQVKQSMNKSELVEIISEGYIEKYLGFVEQMSFGQLEIIEAIKDVDGLVPFDWDINEETIELLETGLVICGNIDGRNCMGITKEVREKLNLDDLRDMIQFSRESNEVIHVVEGMIYFYGMINIDELAEKVYNILNKKYTRAKICEIIDENLNKNQEISIARVENNIISTVLKNPEELLKEHESRKDLNYADIDKETLLSRGDKESKDECEELVKHLIKKYDIDEKNAEWGAYLVSFNIKTGEKLDEVIEAWMTNFNFKDSDEENHMKEMVVRLYNKTRQWGLKGNSLDIIG